MVEPGDIDDLKNEFRGLLDMIDSEGREPSEEESDLLEEISNLIEMRQAELEEKLVDPGDLMIRRELLLAGNPAYLYNEEDGTIEIDTWERWREDYT